MAGLSLYGRSQLLYATFARDLFNASASWWIALTGIVPMQGDTGVHLDEPVDSVYARQPYGHTSAYWAPSGLGVIANAQQIVFPAPAVDWGLLAGWALVDSASGDGNLWLIGEMVAPTRVLSGPDAAVSIEIGQLSLTGL